MDSLIALNQHHIKQMARPYEFDIALDFARDSGGYHLQYPPPDASDSVRIVKCQLVDVIHGYFAPDYGDQASLIVATFKFMDSTPFRRYREGVINWDFAYADPRGDEWPEVVQMSLREQHVMKKETLDASNEANAAAGSRAAGEPAALRVAGDWEPTGLGKAGGDIALYGSYTALEENEGLPNGARWVLQESTRMKTGIPVSLSTALLIRRHPNRAFVGTIQIKAEFDIAPSTPRYLNRTSSTQDYYGKKDDLLFDPARPPTSARYDAMNLDLVILDDIDVAVPPTSTQVTQDSFLNRLLN